MAVVADEEVVWGTKLDKMIISTTVYTIYHYLHDNILLSIKLIISTATQCSTWYYLAGVWSQYIHRWVLIFVQMFIVR